MKHTTYISEEEMDQSLEYQERIKKCKTPFYDLIRNGAIELYTGKNKFEIPKDFGEYGRNLEMSLFKAGSDIILRGDNLEAFIKEERNLMEVADFLVGIEWISWNYCPDDKYSFQCHIEVDVNKIRKNYKRPDDECVYNFLGMKIADTTEWLKGFSYFDKRWNVHLINAQFNAQGYPGPEWPRTRELFETMCLETACNHMIGKGNQLNRYTRLANIVQKRDNLRTSEESQDRVRWLVDHFQNEKFDEKWKA